MIQLGLNEDWNIVFEITIRLISTIIDKHDHSPIDHQIVNRQSIIWKIPSQYSGWDKIISDIEDRFIYK